MNILIYKRNNLMGSAGGVEKVLVTLSNALSERGHTVFLATRDNKNKEDLFFPLSPAVRFKHFIFHFSKLKKAFEWVFQKIGLISVFPALNRPLIIAHALRAYCAEIKPDVIVLAGMPEAVDFETYPVTDCPKIIQLHSHPHIYFNRKTHQKYRRIINHAALIQVLMPSFIDALPSYYHGKSVAIGNAVLPNQHLKNPRKIIVYLARVEPNKGQDILIRAFAKIADKYPDWCVHLYGDLAHQKYVVSCRTLISHAHLENRIVFKGVTDCPMRVLSRASVCAFPSVFEGFGLSLVEAMVTGLPCVGLKSYSAVNELIVPEQNGLLAVDTDDFARQLDRLIADKTLRRRLGDNARQMIQMYNQNTIVDQWEKVMKEVVNG